MIFRVTPIEQLRTSKTWFYTVKVTAREKSEFKDFSNRMLNSNEDRREFTEMVAFLKKIGNKEGALDEYFRAERDADRILMPWTPEIEKSSADDFGLRLYCYRRSDNVVILFNGARKTQRDPEQCPNCRGYFNEAQLFSVAICSAFESGDLFIEKNLLLDVKEGVKLQTK